MARALPSLADSPAGIDSLVRVAVFGEDARARNDARRAIRSAALERSILPASIQGLYDAVAQGKVAGFTDLDVDPSTLVVLDRPTVKEQQRDNYERAAEMTEYIRSIQPAGVEISVGGEIGEVGKENSTVEEFEAFFEGYRERYSGKPISKLSVQTGTAHGGVVNPDGSRAKPTIDFAVLREIRAACRRRGIGGTVQHGASTRPAKTF